MPIICFSTYYICKEKLFHFFDSSKALTKMILNGETINNLFTFAGHEWKNQTETILLHKININYL